MPLPPAPVPQRVVVVGGGVTGLVAARDLVQAGCAVTVLEAGDRLGGQVRTLDWHGAPVDVGAEAIHLGAPHLKALCAELGILDQAIGARPGPSWLYTPRHGLKPLPAGVGPTGPTRFWPVLRTRGMTLPAVLRAGTEPLRARPRTEDIAVGYFTTSRFGREVTERFVEPLLGTLHAGDVNRLSLHATAAQLRGVVESGESMLLRTALQQRAKRKNPAPAGPPPMMFASWPGGLTTLVDALAARCGAEIRTGARATAVERGTETPWLVRTAEETFPADAVLVTLPGRAASAVLGDLAPGLADAVRAERAADVGVVALAFRREDVAGVPAMQGHNGVLLNSSFDGVMKASTFLSSKWSSYDAAEPFILRVSVGRAGQDTINRMADDELVAAVRADLGRVIGLAAEPVDALVTRWPGAMPQLEVGHLERLARLRAKLPAGIVLAGAPFDGLGLSSTVKSARTQAKALLETSGAA